MKIILKQDVHGLGYKYDVIEVKNGYGLNYLIPKGFAVIANDSNVKMRNEEVRQASRKLEKLKGDAQALCEKIEAVTINLTANVGDGGRVFGSITTSMVADELTNKGVEIDRRRISFASEIKAPGSYEAVVDLHREVKAKVKIEVVAAAK